MAIILKMNNRFISIRWKLVSTYLLLILITLSLINFLIYASITQYLIEQKKENLLSQSTIVADQIAPSFLNSPTDLGLVHIENTIKSLSIRLDARVLVASKNGIVIVDSYDDYNGRDISYIAEVKSALEGISSARAYDFKDVGKTLYVGVPIYKEGSAVGAILISCSPKSIFLQVKQISSNFYTLSFVAITITLIVSFIFADILSRPIVELTQVVKKVGDGYKNQMANIESRDELGNLAEAFNTMMKELHNVDEMRKKFVSNVSHELRTPITSLKIISGTLMASKPVEVAIYEDFMCDIDGELDRLNRIIDTLLDLSKLEKDILDLDLQIVELKKILKQVIKMLKPLANQKNITLNLTAHQEVAILCDDLKIRQCFINMISNAIKYTLQNGAVEVILSADKNKAIIHVKDTGIGIPQKDLPHIFERFYRVDSARARQTGGAGLGLAISQQIALLHEGRITVKSIEGEGTVFTVSLPIERSNS